MQLVQNFAGEVSDPNYEADLFKRIAKALRETGITGEDTAIVLPRA